ncbi:hypothetical protein D3C72_1432740 [compost metagenome]
MHDHRAGQAIDAGVVQQAMQDALRLAEAVGVDNAGAAGVCVGLPPVQDLPHQHCLRRPAVDRQAEGAFGDEGIARHRLERIAGAVGFELVVAGGDPDLPAVFDAHLGRAEHMSCGMQAQRDAVVADALAVGQGIEVDARQARQQHAAARFRAQVMGVAETGVVRVGMGNDGALDRAPGIDIEVARRAIQALRAGDDQVAGMGRLGR